MVPLTIDVGVILREISDGDVVPPHDRAAVDRKLPVGIVDEAGRVADQRFQQRGLARAVAADQRDFFAALDIGRERLDHFHAVVGFRDALDFQRMAARMLVHLKADVRTGDIRSRQFRGLQALDFFLARGGLRGTRAGRKTRDEFVQLRDFLFALRVFRFDARANRRLGEHHVVIAAVVHDHGLVVDVGGVRADAVQKMAVVRNDDQHAFVFDQIVLQPVDRIEVQVVGRLVEQQRGRVAEQRLRQQHADFLAALQLAHLALVQRLFQCPGRRAGPRRRIPPCSRLLRRQFLRVRPGACRLCR